VLRTITELLVGNSLGTYQRPRHQQSDGVQSKPFCILEQYYLSDVVLPKKKKKVKKKAGKAPPAW
jgi:hypothetical protein